MNGMNIGIEALVEPVQATDMTIEAAMLEVTEAAVLLQADTEELSMLAMFEENFSAIKTTVEANGIDAGTESLVGGVMSQQLAVWDAEDIEGTVASMEKASESTWEKIKDYIKRVFESMKQFFQKLFLNQAIIQKALTGQFQRVNKIDKPSWKKEGKEFKFKLGEKAADKIETVKVIAQTVFDAVGQKEFEIAEDDELDKLVSGELQKQLKADFKELGKVKLDNDYDHQLAGVLYGALLEVVETVGILNRGVKSIKIRVIKEGSDNAYRPARIVGRTSSILTTVSLAGLYDMRTLVRVLKNVK